MVAPLPRRIGISAGKDQHTDDLPVLSWAPADEFAERGRSELVLPLLEN